MLCDAIFQSSDVKRPKLSHPACSSSTSGVSACPGDTRVRKSTRHRRMRGEKELYVSSKLTLKELKVMVSSFSLQDLRFSQRCGCRFQSCFVLTLCRWGYSSQRNYRREL